MTLLLRNSLIFPGSIFSVYSQPGLESVRIRPVRYQKPPMPKDMYIKPVCTLVRSYMLTDMGDSDTWMHI